MESNFTTGIIIGIIIGVVGVKIFAPTETTDVNPNPQIQTRTVVVPSYSHNEYDYNDDFYYGSVGLHERGF